VARLEAGVGVFATHPGKYFGACDARVRRHGTR
jgi:hypothetical protein